jgi:PleD family two-component response regulator
VTLSIGSAAGHATGPARLEGDELLRAADNALYCAKTNGRKRVERAPETKPASQARASAAR